MQTSTIILMLVGIVAVLMMLVIVLLWLMHRKDEEIKLKIDVIINECFFFRQISIQSKILTESAAL